MDELWTDDDHFSIGGMNFFLVRRDYNSARTTKEHVAIIKNAMMINQYKRLIEQNSTKKILEFGIFEGGSALLLASLFEDIKIVGIDIRPASPAVRELIREHGLTDRVKLYYNTSQSDAARVREIIKKEFGDDGVDMIIDDASHQYELSRASFEASFPHLAKGGLYLLEDWAWAHWQEPYQTKLWVDAPALTNLVFELIMVIGGRSNLLSEIEVQKDMVIFRKGDRGSGEFRLSNNYLHRGKWAATL